MHKNLSSEIYKYICVYICFKGFELLIVYNCIYFSFVICNVLIAFLVSWSLKSNSEYYCFGILFLVSFKEVSCLVSGTARWELFRRDPKEVWFEPKMFGKENLLARLKLS